MSLSFTEPFERIGTRGMISRSGIVNFPAQRVGAPETEGGPMQPSAEFVSEVETHLDQALLEGWVSAKNTAAVLAVGIGVLLTHVEAMDPNAARLVRRLLLTAVGAV